MAQLQPSMDIIDKISSPEMLDMNTGWSRPSLLVYNLLLCQNLTPAWALQPAGIPANELMYSKLN